MFISTLAKIMIEKAWELLQMVAFSWKVAEGKRYENVGIFSQVKTIVALNIDIGYL